MKSKGQPARKRFGSLEAATQTRKPTPFLKWAGGKTRLLSQMSIHFPHEFRRYFEPFLGGGAVFFHLQPSKAFLSDSNCELIDTFKVVRNSPMKLMQALDAHYPYRKDKDYYYKVRELDSSRLPIVERAARTIYLNKTCYNGLYRVNSKGLFNVPFGRYANPTLYDREALLAASRALKSAELSNKDYGDCCASARRGDFVYLDPPYHPLSVTSSFTGYTKNSFGEDDQVLLAEAFKSLDKSGCKVMLSNSSTPLIRELYSEFRIATLKAPRAISCKGHGRGKIDEVLVLNYE